LADCGFFLLCSVQDQPAEAEPWLHVPSNFWQNTNFYDKLIFQHQRKCQETSNLGDGSGNHWNLGIKEQDQIHVILGSTNKVPVSKPGDHLFNGRARLSVSLTKLIYFHFSYQDETASSEFLRI
jgi:hypothetical protein